MNEIRRRLNLVTWTSAGQRRLSGNRPTANSSTAVSHVRSASAAFCGPAQCRVRDVTYKAVALFTTTSTRDGSHYFNVCKQPVVLDYYALIKKLGFNANYIAKAMPLQCEYLNNYMCLMMHALWAWLLSVNER